MDTQRRKELLYAWKNRRPRMGVISVRCKETGNSYLDISKDTDVAYNSIRCRLSSGSHPNKVLQALWDLYGEAGFEYTVLETLDYEDPAADHTLELEDIRTHYLESDKKAKKVWK